MPALVAGSAIPHRPATFSAPTSVPHFHSRLCEESFPASQSHRFSTFPEAVLAPVRNRNTHLQSPGTGSKSHTTARRKSVAACHYLAGRHLCRTEFDLDIYRRTCAMRGAAAPVHRSSPRSQRAYSGTDPAILRRKADSQNRRHAGQQTGGVDGEPSPGSAPLATPGCWESLYRERTNRGAHSIPHTVR